MSGSKTNIFSQLGAVSQSVIEKDRAFITITKVGGTSGGTGDIRTILASAPVTAVNIKQLTDFSITKSLSNDFLVASFGDTPVQIQMQGINIIGINNCMLEASSSDSTRTQIMEFYKKNKVSSDLTARFDVAIAQGPNQPAVGFRCIIIALDVNNSNQSGMNTVHKTYNYSMSLIGANKA